MEIANVLLAIGGNRGNTVPKYDVTAAEAAVLRLVHGEDAVFDIELTGKVVRTHRQEIARLSQTYGRQEGERRIAPAVEALYPGAAARVFETYAELEIPEEFFVAVSRRTTREAPPTAVLPAADEPAFADMTVNELRACADKMGVDLAGITKKADIVEALELHAANAEPDIDENDGTGPMFD